MFLSMANASKLILTLRPLLLRPRPTTELRVDVLGSAFEGCQRESDAVDSEGRTNVETDDGSGSFGVVDFNGESPSSVVTGEFQSNVV